MLTDRVVYLRGPLLICLGVLLIAGCARGLVKEGPTGESGKGISLKVPVLGFARKETYDAENLSTGNLKEDELNPFQKAEDNPPPTSLLAEER